MTGAEGGVIWTVGAYAPLSLPSMRLRDRHIGEIGEELGNASSATLSTKPAARIVAQTFRGVSVPLARKPRNTS